MKELLINAINHFPVIGGIMMMVGFVIIASIIVSVLFALYENWKLSKLPPYQHTLKSGQIIYSNDAISLEDPTDI